MSFAQKIALAAVLCLPVVLPFVLAMIVRARVPGRRLKLGFAARVAASSYGLAIAAAFFMSLVLRTVSPSILTGDEPLAPVFAFVQEYEPEIAACVLDLGAIFFSWVLFPRRQGEAGAAETLP